MRVFVTGASGFVGGHLLPVLRRAGWQVFAADREVDVTRESELRSAFRESRPDAVIHLAAQSSVAASLDDPIESFRINFLGSLNVISAACAEIPASRLILVGSSDCYGARSHAGPIDEACSLMPESPYARSKAAAEMLGAAAADHGQDVVRVRAFTHIGVGQTDRFVTSSLARQVAEIAEARREPYMLVGNLDSVRDFLDVRDVVSAYCRLLDASVPAGVYNVASGRGVAIREILEHLVAIAGVAPKIEVDPARYRPTDHRIGDASKLRGTTGWKPEIPLEQTLAELVDFWRKQSRTAPVATTP